MVGIGKLSAYEDYFEEINTKDKAYWLGFLYADGNVSTYNSSYKVSIHLKKRDNSIIEKFKRDLNLGCKTSLRKDHTISLCVCRKKMVIDLIRHGCIPNKSKFIELPELPSRELYLAFLLGFFDGDGTQNQTRITCGSRKFLQEIKEKFTLPYKIYENKGRSKTLGTRIVYGRAFVMYLGGSLFNEMIDNYMDSLPRKRKHFCTNKERIELIRKNAWNGNLGKKLDIEKKELQKLVWEMPSERIAKKFGVSGRLITKRCQQLKIKKPPRGYWAKIKSISRKKSD